MNLFQHKLQPFLGCFPAKQRGSLKIIPFIFSALYLLFPTTVLAADPIGILQPPASIITTEADIGRVFISNALRLIIAMAGVWSLFQFVIAGFTWITAAGDAKKIAEVQKKIFDAIIGLFIIAASFLIAGIIGYLFFDRADFILNPTIETVP